MSSMGVLRIRRQRRIFRGTGIGGMAICHPLGAGTILSDDSKAVVGLSRFAEIELTEVSVRIVPMLACSLLQRQFGHGFFSPFDLSHSVVESLRAHKAQILIVCVLFSKAKACIVVHVEAQWDKLSCISSNPSRAPTMRFVQPSVFDRLSLGSLCP